MSGASVLTPLIVFLWFGFVIVRFAGVNIMISKVVAGFDMHNMNINNQLAFVYNATN